MTLNWRSTFWWRSFHIICVWGGQKLTYAIDSGNHQKVAFGIHVYKHKTNNTQNTW